MTAALGHYSIVHGSSRVAKQRCEILIYGGAGQGPLDVGAETLNWHNEGTDGRTSVGFGVLCGLLWLMRSLTRQTGAATTATPGHATHSISRICSQYCSDSPSWASGVNDETAAAAAAAASPATISWCYCATQTVVYRLNCFRSGSRCADRQFRSRQLAGSITWFGAVVTTLDASAK